jgi:hypothetical protein
MILSSDPTRWQEEDHDPPQAFEKTSPMKGVHQEMCPPICAGTIISRIAAKSGYAELSSDFLER